MATTFYVNGTTGLDSNSGLSTGAAFATIQAAIDAAADGDIVIVSAGHYGETLAIDVRVEIRGANYGLDPNVDGRGPETIIESFDDIAVTIAANGVILDGLQITGHGFDGVIANDYANSVVVTDVEIRNNIVEGTHPDVWDIYFYNSPDTPTHAVVSNNHISGGHIGVIGYNNGYIDVLDNVIDNVDVGVQTGNMWQPAPGGDTPVIAGNQISANHVGIFHNLQYSTATGYSIHDNSVWGADGAWDDGVGIILWSLYGTAPPPPPPPPEPTIQDNNVSGFAAGYELWNDPTGVTIEGGDVSGNGIGIAAVDFSSYGDGADSSYTLDGVQFHDNGVDLQAADADVTIDDSGTPTTISTYNIQGDGHFDAGNLAGPLPSPSGTLGNDVILAEAGNQTIDALDGNDTYDMRVAGSGPAIVDLELGAGGVASSAATGLDFLSNFENVIGGAGNDLIAGNNDWNDLDGAGGDDYLQGRGGDDRLDGGTGADTMAGGWDNDIYFVDNADDVVIEYDNDGWNDTVHTSVSYTLSDNVENLVLDASHFDDFENFAIGPITDGENGWKTAGNHDQEIVQLTDGNKVFRMSSDPSSDDFGGPYSPGLSVSAGEPSTTADGDTHVIAFKLKSVSDSADNSRLEVDFGTDVGLDRNSFMIIENVAGGLRVAIAHIAPNGEFEDDASDVFPEDWITLPSSLDPEDWHDFELRLHYNDDADNDVIEIWVDGTKLGETQTFENYRDALGGTHETNAEANQTNRVFFRAGGNGQPADGPGGQNQGFYFDNVQSTVHADIDGTGNDLNNEIIGNDGHNELDGQGGFDTIHGNGGNDSIYGGDGWNWLYGEWGNDTITVQIGDFGYFDGGDDDDTLHVEGNDSDETVNIALSGDPTPIITGIGPGLDNFEHVTLDMGDGEDLLTYENVSVAVTVDLDNGEATGFDWIDNVENVRGGSGGDSLTGDGNANVLEGGDGNDEIDGGNGIDTAVFGGAINDYEISFNSGTYTIKEVGGTETDTVTNVEKFVFGGTLYDTAGTSIVNGAAPSFTSSGSATVLENVPNPIVYVAHATDADSSSTFGAISYALEGVDAGLFTINAASGEVRLIGTADREADNAYAITVRATQGVSSSTKAVAISVTDVNDNAPVFQSGTTASVAEGAPVATVVYDANATDADTGFGAVVFSLGGADAEAFTIDAGTGQVRLKSSADFESKASYAFTVTAAQGSTSTVRNVALGVTNVNEGIGGLSGPTLIVEAGSTKTPIGSVGSNAAATFDVVTVNAGGGQVHNGTTLLAAGQTGLTLAQVNALTFSSGSADGAIQLLAHNGGDSTVVNIVLDVTAAVSTTYNGTSAADRIDGADGNDKVNGKAGADFLLGGAGKDSIDGGSGNDTINGGLGKDQLKGGSGADHFVFDTALQAGKYDTISDFKHGTDKIAIDDALLNIGVSLTSPEFHASNSGKAHDASDRIIYDKDDGKLFYDADGNGSGKAIQIATLSSHPTLTASDFLIV